MCVDSVQCTHILKFNQQTENKVFNLCEITSLPSLALSNTQPIPTHLIHKILKQEGIRRRICRLFSVF